MLRGRAHVSQTRAATQNVADTTKQRCGQPWSRKKPHCRPNAISPKLGGRSRFVVRATTTPRLRKVTLTTKGSQGAL